MHAQRPAFFSEGDIVVGIALKNQGDWHGHRCKIISILTNFYKVKMLEGPKKGKDHRYQFKFVKAPDQPPQGQLGFGPASAAHEGDAAASAAPKLSSSPSLQDMTDLFGES